MPKPQLNTKIAAMEIELTELRVQLREEQAKEKALKLRHMKPSKITLYKIANLEHRMRILVRKHNQQKRRLNYYNAELTRRESGVQETRNKLIDLEADLIQTGALYQQDITNTVARDRITELLKKRGRLRTTLATRERFRDAWILTAISTVKIPSEEKQKIQSPPPYNQRKTKNQPPEMDLAQQIAQAILKESEERNKNPFQLKY